MTPTETLKHEHQIILLVLDAVEREMRQIQAGGPLDEARIEQMIDFIRNFADRCHHAKEETLLFARMENGACPCWRSDRRDAGARRPAFGAAGADALPGGAGYRRRDGSIGTSALLRRRQ
jgi:hypothetical protein